MTTNQWTNYTIQVVLPQVPTPQGQQKNATVSAKQPGQNYHFVSIIVLTELQIVPGIKFSRLTVCAKYLQQL